MANEKSPDLIARPGGKPEAGGAAGVQGVLQKFRALPPKAQGAIVVVGLLVVFYMFSSRSNNASRQQGGVINLGQPQGNQVSPTFTGLETDRPAVMQSVFEQNRRDMSELRTKIESDFATRDKALQEALTQNQELQRQMQQMMDDFTTELKNIQIERARDNEKLSQLADQQQQMEMSAPVNGVGQVSGTPKRKAITQVNLSGGNSGAVGLLTRPFGKTATTQPTTRLNSSGLPVLSPSEQAEKEKLPFMPPLGFVHATLLNGVDALTAGSTTPALARLSGTYKTAMNSTVSLDGCIAMLEFEGNISTERATGKPVRMTCVYPDGGASTYSLSGYVVDADDGIIGVPGVLYEGDPKRVAGAMMAEFAAGIAQIVGDSQETNTVDSDGTTQSVITGSQAKAQIAGGASKAMSSLSNYMQQRVSRVQSFIRLDATREVNLVILNGTELRKTGEGWSNLFDANTDAGTPKSQLPAATTAEQAE